VNAAENHSLILIDEIGSGTDPAEGSALAIAVLEELNLKGRVTMVTTHHSELKIFAHKMENIQNGAMQFDRNTLAPKFLMEVGVPGSSYAFDISRRLGVKNSILERAQHILGKSHHELEEMILELSEIKQQYQEKLSAMSVKESELAGMHSLYRTRSEELKKKKKQYEKTALQESQEILDNVNKTIESVIREIRESHADRQVIKKGRQKLDQLKQDVNKRMDRPSEKPVLQIKDLRIGMAVQSRRFGIKGQIAQIFSEKNEIEIESNGMKLIIPLNDLIVNEKDTGAVQIHDVQYTATAIPYELDLRGMIAEDAVLELERYLDSALQSNWQELRVIHGKGTGALRQKIHAYLKKNKRIESFRLGNVGEGDTGVTIIKL
jgi:DNA mismatch repair protein MutS2